MASMRFVTFEADGQVKPGVISDVDAVLDLSTVGFPSLLQFIEAGPDALEKAAAFADQSPASARHKLHEVKLQSADSAPAQS